ncbi:MAG TPA: ACT domain-containing protein [Sphingomicrobium sp.]|nr:ACT domain-containing protein [Sphingomicrobium sp.]
MSDRLLLELDWEIGTLQRLIGVIERRGFKVIAIELNASGGARQMAVDVQPRREPKDFAVLARQVDRLHGVVRLGSSPVEQGFSIRHRFPLVG